MIVSRSLIAVFAAGLSSSLASCNSKKKVEPAASASTTQGVSSATTQPAMAKKPTVFNIPVGPKLGVFPGQGVGPVRFGATIETIERLMEAPCTEKSASICRYAAHAIDFHLKDGVLVKIQIQGDERQFDDNPEHTYGIFNGQFPQGAALGMYPQYVINMLGEPLRKEKVAGSAKTVPGGAAEPSPPGLQERHFYKDATVEYDKLANGNVVLASIILEKPKP